jgi:serine/threonine-protein kinase
MRLGRVFFIVVVLFCIFETMRLWTISPEQMAAHFNVEGNPDRFVPKAQFFWFQVQTLLIVIGLSIPLQLLFLFIPVNLINMPNREYWLAPERHAEIRERLSSFASILFGLILLLVHVVFELAVSANLQQPIMFNAQLMIPVMISFFIGIGALLVWLGISFHRPLPNE